MATKLTFRLSITGNKKLCDVHVDLKAVINDDTAEELMELLSQIQSVKRVHPLYISNGNSTLWLTLACEKRNWREMNAYARDSLTPMIAGIVPDPNTTELETVGAVASPRKKQRYINRSHR